MADLPLVARCLRITGVQQEPEGNPVSFKSQAIQKHLVQEFLSCNHAPRPTPSVSKGYTGMRSDRMLGKEGKYPTPPCWGSSQNWYSSMGSRVEPTLQQTLRSPVQTLPCSIRRQILKTASDPADLALPEANLLSQGTLCALAWIFDTLCHIFQDELSTTVSGPGVVLWGVCRELHSRFLGARRKKQENKKAKKPSVGISRGPSPLFWAMLQE